jgi:hypothetical protein
VGEGGSWFGDILQHQSNNSFSNFDFEVNKFSINKVTLGNTEDIRTKKFDKIKQYSLLIQFFLLKILF